VAANSGLHAAKAVDSPRWLRGPAAVQVNIGIVRAFVRLREMIATDRELVRKVEQHDRQIAVLFNQGLIWKRVGGFPM
jgi:hypothetical protein